MRAIILILFFTISCTKIYSQNDSALDKKSIVLSGQLSVFYGIVPNKLSLNLSSFNLNYNLYISYCSEFYSFGFARPGFEIGYSQYFFKKFGPKLSISYFSYHGDFTFPGENAKYKGYTELKDLQLLSFGLGFYYRFKLKQFGIFEPSLNINYFYPTKIIYDDFLKSNHTSKVFPTIDLKYYFIRNKPKK